MKPLLLSLMLSAAACLGADQTCAKHVVVPGYPRLARVARLEGTVNVEIQVDSRGKVISAKASGGHKLLQSASEENIREWTFDSSMLSGGQPRRLQIAYLYRLEGKEQYHDAPPKVILDLPDRVEIIAHPPEPQP
jgi:TonB family protein